MGWKAANTQYAKEAFNVMGRCSLMPAGTLETYRWSMLQNGPLEGFLDILPLLASLSTSFFG